MDDEFKLQLNQVEKALDNLTTLNENLDDDYTRNIDEPLTVFKKYRKIVNSIDNHLGDAFQSKYDPANLLNYLNIGTGKEIPSICSFIDNYDKELMNEARLVAKKHPKKLYKVVNMSKGFYGESDVVVPIVSDDLHHLINYSIDSLKRIIRFPQIQENRKAYEEGKDQIKCISYLMDGLASLHFYSQDDLVYNARNDKERMAMHAHNNTNHIEYNQDLILLQIKSRGVFSSHTYHKIVLDTQKLFEQPTNDRYYDELNDVVSKAVSHKKLIQKIIG